MIKRLFTFGCSFTNFYWPTWADMLAREFSWFENWGRNGAGNAFIFHSLTECIRRRNINQQDTIVIMWSSIDRHDRWVKGGWRLEGGVYNDQPEFDTHYLENFADPTGFLIRDLSLISGARQILDALGCEYYFLSMVPFSYQDRCWAQTGITYHLDSDVIDLYRLDIEKIRPSIYEVVFNGNWYSRPGYCDLSYLETSYTNLAGPDWPSLADFVKLNFAGIKRSIINEISGLLNLDKNRIRTDTHPVPAEHLEYLDHVLPELPISEATRAWTHEINARVLALDPEFSNGPTGSWRTKVALDRF